MDPLSGLCNLIEMSFVSREMIFFLWEHYFVD